MGCGYRCLVCDGAGGKKKGCVIKRKHLRKMREANINIVQLKRTTKYLWPLLAREIHYYCTDTQNCYSNRAIFQFHDAEGTFYVLGEYEYGIPSFTIGPIISYDVDNHCFKRQSVIVREKNDFCTCIDWNYVFADAVYCPECFLESGFELLQGISELQIDSESEDEKFGDMILEEGHWDDGDDDEKDGEGEEGDNNKNNNDDDGDGDEEDEEYQGNYEEDDDVDLRRFLKFISENTHFANKIEE